jgi:hypothetical protein
MRGLIQTGMAVLLAASVAAPSLGQQPDAMHGPGATEAPVPRGPSRMEVAPGPVGRAPLPQQRPGVGDDLGPAPGMTGNPLLLAPNRASGDRPSLRLGVGGAPGSWPAGEFDGEADLPAAGSPVDGAFIGGAPVQDPLVADPAVPGTETEPLRGAPPFTGPGVDPFGPRSPGAVDVPSTN